MPLVRRLAVLAGFLVVAAAWSGQALAADIVPVNDTAPSLSDYRPRLGETLSVSTGTWHDEDTGGTNLPIAYSYQWFSCGNPVAGATGSSYTTTQSDADCQLQVDVTATNALGSKVASSDASLAIFPHDLFTDHVVVQYTSDLGAPGAITTDQAGQIASLAEQAYAAETAAGYTVPGDGALGGDSRLDIQVVPIATVGVLADTQPDSWTSPQTSSYIQLNASDPSEAFTLHTIAHELFHVIQVGTWLPSSESDFWLLEGSAEWMGYKVDGFPPGDLELGDWSMSLDCRNTVTDTPCDLSDSYKGNGYSRWPFFEYLAERYGNDAVTSIFQQGASGGGPAIAAVARAIAAKGGSLGDFFTDWAVTNMTGDYKAVSLQGLEPPVFGSIETGTLASLNLTTADGAPKVTSGPIPPLTVPVNHLSARYVAIVRGNANAPDAPCYAASLKLNVTVPSGTGAHPYFWWSQKAKDGTNLQAPQALSVDGNGNASITVPWDTCDWDGTQGYVVLANPSTTVDGASFSISGTLTVDRSTQATPTPPPDPVRMHGSTVDSSSAEAGDVPEITVFGPQVLRLAANAKQIRLVVTADGSGQLKAALGSLVLGTKPIRAGGNDLRFTLPKTAQRVVRKVAASANVLTLTPLSPSGAPGTPITRRVVVGSARR